MLSLLNQVRAFLSLDMFLLDFVRCTPLSWSKSCYSDLTRWKNNSCSSAPSRGSHLTRAFKWDVNTKEYMSDMTNSTFSSSSVVSVIWESAKMGGSISDKPWQALRHLRCGKKSGCLSLMSSPPFVASTALSRERKVFSRHHYSSLPLGASGRSPFVGLGLQHHLMQWGNVHPTAAASENTWPLPMG